MQKYEKSLILIFNNFKDKKNPKLSFEIPYPQISIDLSDNKTKDKLIDFILKAYKPKKKEKPLFAHLQKDDLVFLNIPMDEETPEKRLLRPQSFVQEHLIRRYISTFAYRMDLKKARSSDKNISNDEFLRFQKQIKILKNQNFLKLLITDSQAIDIVHKWTLDENNKPIVDITTFSVIMAHEKYDLSTFINGIEAFQKLKENDKILIAEACNHNRIKEDIGTYQIPLKLNKYFGEGKIQIDHAFGRDFASYNLNNYKLIIHCGGCMLDKQSMQARIKDLQDTNVPITNYGIMLAYLNSKEAFSRVIKPFE